MLVFREHSKLTAFGSQGLNAQGPAVHNILSYLGGCQNSDPFCGTLNIRCRIIIIGIQKGARILTTAHLGVITHALLVIGCH